MVINIETFKQILLKFTDNPEDFYFDKDEFGVEVDGVLHTGKITEEDDLLYIRDIDKGSSRKIKAKKWISTNLGKLDILARVIKEKIKNDNHYIEVPCTYSELTNKEEKSKSTVEQLLKTIKGESKSLGTSVIYLKSEAGEGKTSIMYKLARMQVDKFLHNESEWLFIPIELTGRPFLRLDDIIVGALVNFYRFRGYHIGSFLELIKMGLIVLGLDGFEEMTIEGADGNLISSLGSLLRSLESQGTLVFATRKAYYEYSNPQMQSTLFDSFDDNFVNFSEITLSKWSRDQFISLLGTFKVSESQAESYYDKITEKINPDHPILTRAMWVRNIVDQIFKDNSENKSLVTEFEKFQMSPMDDTSDIMAEFIESTLEREQDKWSTGDIEKTPILTLEEHKEMLENIAEEMWTLQSGILKLGIITAVVEYFCELLRKSPSEMSNLTERIKSHVLLESQPPRIRESRSGSSKEKKIQSFTKFSFVHEEFYYHFLGRAIARAISKNKILIMRKLLSKKTIPLSVVNTCVHTIVKKGAILQSIKSLIDLTQKAHKYTLLSQNLFAILIPLLSKRNRDKSEIVNIDDLYCSGSVMEEYSAYKIKFTDCIFEKIICGRYNNTNKFEHCELVNCEIEEIILKQKNSPLYSTIKIHSDCTINHLSLENEKLIYDPQMIWQSLRGYGFTILQVADSELSESSIEIEEDQEIVLLFRIINVFQRTTSLEETVMQLKIGDKWNEFRKKVIPKLVRHEIFREILDKGAGNKRRFRLMVSFSELANARKLCKGNFDNFIDLIDS